LLLVRGFGHDHSLGNPQCTNHLGHGRDYFVAAGRTPDLWHLIEVTEHQSFSNMLNGTSC
jgi:hypothetical protein